MENGRQCEPASVGGLMRARMSEAESYLILTTPNLPRRPQAAKPRPL